MIRALAGLGGMAVVALIAACGSSSSTTPTSTPAAAGTATTSTTAAAGGTAAPEVNVTLDPCQLVTASEASSLAGATFSTGTEQTNTDTAGGSSRTCVYGGSTLNVFQVTVAQASSASVAQAQWAQQEASVQSKITSASSQLPAGTTFNYNVNDTSVSGADKAATVSASTSVSGHTLSISGIYLLKGAAFAAITDLVLGTSAPSASAMESQAATTVGRM